jgi:hypothetical protein
LSYSPFVQGGEVDADDDTGHGAPGLGDEVPVQQLIGGLEGALGGRPCLAIEVLR